jgi:hypothetical protein
MMKLRGRGVLDTPPEPVIGLAEGETRWRGMTVMGWTIESDYPVVPAKPTGRREALPDDRLRASRDP